MWNLVCLLATLSFALSHELSDLYKAYKSSGGVTVRHPTFHKVLSPASKDQILRAKELFAPPLPGQSAVDYHPQLKQLPLSDEDPFVYYSWHIHAYFFHEDANVTARSMALRDRFMAEFTVPMCDDSCFMGGPFDTCIQGMCAWEPVYGVDGPHPYGQWGIYLPNELVAQTLTWMSANHGEFEVFFHPNTGYMVGDHSPDKRAVWIKQQVPLDLDFLVWLQCQWFGCSDQVSIARVSL